MVNTTVSCNSLSNYLSSFGHWTKPQPKQNWRNGPRPSTPRTRASSSFRLFWVSWPSNSHSHTASINSPKLKMSSSRQCSPSSNPKVPLSQSRNFGTWWLIWEKNCLTTSLTSCSRSWRWRRRIASITKSSSRLFSIDDHLKLPSLHFTYSLLL